MDRKARRIASTMAIVVVLMAAVPAVAAVFRGSIAHASLQPGQSLAGTVPVAWSWNSGSRVDSSDRVNLYVSTNGSTWRWVTVAPIRQGAMDLDTTALPDSTYYFKLKVAYEPAISVVGPVIVDNTSPEVFIRRPSQGQLIVDDETPDAAVVAGNATLEAAAFDNLSGVGAVTWLLDEQEIATGAVAEYDFSSVPGPHTLSVIATDVAGNQDSHSIEIVALPGPKATMDGTELPSPPEGDPTESLPSVPNPEDLPDPTESLPPVPNPDDLPDPTESLPPVPNPDDPGTVPSPPEGEPEVPNVIPTP